MIPVDFNRHVFRFLPQPAKRIRKTHNKLPHRRNNFLSCCRFILADKGQIIRIFLFTKRITRLAEGIRKKLFPLGSGADSENRINPCQLEFLPDQVLAEGMDRADLHDTRFFRCSRYHRILPFRKEAFPDLLFHFSRRGVCEGDYQKRKRICPFPNQAHNPFDHYCRFTAPGRSRTNKSSGRRPDYPLLILCPLRHCQNLRFF